MRLEAMPEAAALMRAAEKGRLGGSSGEGTTTILDRAAIEDLVPHRAPCLLIDRVTHLDAAAGLVIARCDLGPYAAVFAGHFPGRPTWPGTLQVEAIGQAGLVLHAHASARARPGPAGFGLTDILAARFLRPVGPGGELEVVARVIEDGLFRIVVGQCLVEGIVCSAATVRGIEGGTEA